MRHRLRAAATLAVLTACVAALSGCAFGNLAANTYHSQLVAAADSKLKSDLLDAAIAADTYAVNNDGSYSGATATALESTGFRASEVPAKFAIVVNSSGSDLCIQGTTKFGRTAHVVSDGTLAAGDCPAH